MSALGPPGMPKSQVEPVSVSPDSVSVLGFQCLWFKLVEAWIGC